MFDGAGSRGWRRGKRVVHDRRKIHARNQHSHGDRIRDAQRLRRCNDVADRQLQRQLRLASQGAIGPNTATHPASGSISVPVTLTGTNLTGATALTGLGTGVSVATGTFHVVGSTSVTATLNIASSATAGIRNITVTTPIGTTNTVAFTVN